MAYEPIGPLGMFSNALNWVGSSLDKPGAGMRGLLSGAMGGRFGGGLLNWIPFSDTLGITKEEDRITPHDLTVQAHKQLGFIPEDLGPMGDFALSIATDPTTYLGGAAIGGMSKLMRGGKAAKAAAQSAELATKAKQGFNPLHAAASYAAPVAGVGLLSSEEAQESPLLKAIGYGLMASPLVPLGMAAAKRLKGAKAASKAVGAAPVVKAAAPDLHQMTKDILAAKSGSLVSDVPLDSLYESLAKAKPDLTVPEFHAVVQKLQADKAIRGVPYTQARYTMPESLQKVAINVPNNDPLAYVGLVKPTPSRAFTVAIPLGAASLSAMRNAMNRQEA